MLNREALKSFLSIHFAIWMVVFIVGWLGATAFGVALDFPPQFMVFSGIVLAWGMDVVLERITDSYAEERGGEFQWLKVARRPESGR